MDEDDEKKEAPASEEDEDKEVEKTVRGWIKEEIGSAMDPVMTKLDTLTKALEKEDEEESESDSDDDDDDKEKETEKSDVPLAKALEVVLEHGYKIEGIDHGATQRPVGAAGETMAKSDDPIAARLKAQIKAIGGGCC